MQRIAACAAEIPAARKPASAKKRRPCKTFAKEPSKTRKRTARRALFRAKRPGEHGSRPPSFLSLLLNPAAAQNAGRQNKCSTWNILLARDFAALNNFRMLAKIYIFSIIFLFIAVFPTLIIFAIEKKRGYFSGLKGIAAVLIISALSWLFINAAIFIPWALSLYRIRGPEAAFALLFGWAYIWFAPIPAFAIFWLYKICEKLDAAE